MSYWPWWFTGFGLAAVAVTHWLTTQRLMAVSGRFTALVNRLRFGKTEAGELSQQELVSAIQQATLEEFGEDPTHEAADEAPMPEVATASALPASPPSRSTANHLLFLGALACGGFLSVVLQNDYAPSFHLASRTLSSIAGGHQTGVWVLLLLGGILVGFGTRMAGGCTSGHGLCGVSRLQAGSIVATLSFFATGILTSFVLSWL